MGAGLHLAAARQIASLQLDWCLRVLAEADERDIEPVELIEHLEELL
jgi:hypothetical protein